MEYVTIFSALIMVYSSNCYEFVTQVLDYIL